MSPCRLRLLFPIAESLQSELQHPFRLTFLGRDEPDDVLVESYRDYLRMYVRREAELIFLFGYLTDVLIFLFHAKVT